MRKKTFTTIAAAVTLVAGLAACSSDDNDVDISIPDDDVDCCSLEEEELTIRYLQDYEQIGSVGELQTDIYTIRLYSAGGKLTVGYNELFFTVIKTATGRHVKDVEFDSIAPLMTMRMAMGTHSHSTPTGAARRVASWIPVFRSHIAFLMPSNASAGNTWQLASGRGAGHRGRLHLRPRHRRGLSGAEHGRGPRRGADWLAGLQPTHGVAAAGAMGNQDLPQRADARHGRLAPARRGHQHGHARAQPHVGGLHHGARHGRQPCRQPLRRRLPLGALCRHDHVSARRHAHVHAHLARRADTLRRPCAQRRGERRRRPQHPSVGQD